MKNHTKIFIEHYNICEQDIFMCQFCDAEQMVDVHHIKFKSHCGNDKIDNLIGLGRKCHLEAHGGHIKADELQAIIDDKLSNEITYQEIN